MSSRNNSQRTAKPYNRPHAKSEEMLIDKKVRWDIGLQDELRTKSKKAIEHDDRAVSKKSSNMKSYSTASTNLLELRTPKLHSILQGNSKSREGHKRS